MSLVFVNMDIIDLFQEAFNFMATFYTTIYHPVCSCASFSLENYFKLFPQELKEINNKYKTIKPLLVMQTFTKEQIYQINFGQLIQSSKNKIIDLLCENIHLQKLPQKIESYLLDETCLSCFFKQHTRKWFFCDSCPTDVYVIEVDRSNYEKMFEDHLNGDILYDL